MSLEVRFVTLGGLVLFSSALAFGGCTVDVSLAFECVADDGETHQAGDSFAQGCNTCTCNGDGTIACTEMGCGSCEWNGEVHEIGTTFDAGDGCNRCECLATGEASCTLLDCPTCDEEPPICAQDPGEPDDDFGCWYQPECDPSGNWNCVYSCDGCEGAPIPDCPPPQEGCFYSAPVCIDQSWTCGDLICEGTCDDEPPPECLQPPDPGCYADVVCTEMGWQCEIYCEPVCEDPEPACDLDSFAECTDQGWVCTPFNTTCPDLGMVDCPPPLDPFCSVYAVCHSDGEWFCQEDCAPRLCMGPQPDPDQCPDVQPACSQYVACTSSDDWQCVETCF